MSPSSTQFGEILGLLKAGEVQFILIGGLAAMAHGTARATLDVDWRRFPVAAGVISSAFLLSAVHSHVPRRA